MYVESVKFTRTEDSEVEEGFYIGETDNSEKGVFLDKDYNPLPKDEDGCSVYRYWANLENHIQIRC